MIEIGRLCVKTAGRDAGKGCIIIDVIDDNLVIVDGYARRKKVNIRHLEPLKHVAGIKKNAAHEEVIAELEKIGMSEKKKKARKEGKKEKAAEQKEEKKEIKEKKAKKAKASSKKAQ